MSDLSLVNSNEISSPSIRRQFEQEFDFLHVFERNARRFAKAIALSDPINDRRWTYKELDDQANQWANALRALGLQYGDVLKVALFNSPEFVFAYLASEKIGAVFCPLNYNWSPDEVAYAFEDSRPKIFLYDSELEELVVKAFKRADDLNNYAPEKRFVVGAKRDDAPFGTLWEPYCAKFGIEKSNEPREGTIFDEIARLYTSGTTGRAKGVPLSRVNETAAAHEVAMRYPMDSRDVTINTTPWFHRGGFHGGLTPTLYVGGEVVVLRRFNATVCLKILRERQATILLGVPSATVMVARKQEKAEVPIDCVRLLVMMGSDLDRSTCEYLQSVFKRVGLVNCYGTTESFLNTFLDSRDLPKKAGSAGRASYDDDVVLVEPLEDGWGDPAKPVARDGKTLGEVAVRCSTKTTGGYFNKPQETARKFHNGWLYTGDLATWDDEEYVSIVGRKDDMMISAGENVYPQPIEEAICKHSKVADCVVVSVVEPTRGQALVAYVVRSDESLTVRELLKFCSESSSLSSFSTPRFYKFVRELPYTPTGKKQRYVLKAQAPLDLKNGALSRN